MIVPICLVAATFLIQCTSSWHIVFFYDWVVPTECSWFRNPSWNEDIVDIAVLAIYNMHIICVGTDVRSVCIRSILACRLFNVPWSIYIVSLTGIILQYHCVQQWIANPATDLPTASAVVYVNLVAVCLLPFVRTAIRFVQTSRLKTLLPLWQRPIVFLKLESEKLDDEQNAKF